MDSSEHIEYAGSYSQETLPIKRHPFSLGYDISICILEHLPLVDVICFEGVSKEWQSFMREWLKSAEARLTLLPPWSSVTSIRECNALSYDEAKRIIATRHRIQTGKSASYNHLTNVDDLGDFCQLAARGGLLAWRRAGNAPRDFARDPPAWVTDYKITAPDTIICRRVSQEDPSHEETPRPTICLRKNEGMRGKIKVLRINLDGVLLISVACMPQDQRDSRLIVYSTVDHRTLWDFPNDWSFRPDWGFLTPLEIGRELVYCAAPLAKHEWNLVAYNFRTREKVYEVSSLCLHTHPGEPRRLICSCDNPYSIRPSAELCELSRLLSTKRSGEFLVRSWTRVPTPLELQAGKKPYMARRTFHMHNIQIVRGSDGGLVQTLPRHWFGASDVLVDPVTDQLVVVWTNFCAEDVFYISSPDSDLNGRYNATVILPIDMNAEGGRRIGDAVVFLHRETGNAPFSLIHPFAMAQLDLRRQRSTDKDDRPHLLTHTPFKQTTDPVFLQAAERSVRTLFAADRPAISHCYRPEDGSRRGGTPYSGAPSPGAIVDWNNTWDWDVPTRTQMRFVGDAHERLVVPTARSDRLCFDYV